MQNNKDDVFSDENLKRKMNSFDFENFFKKQKREELLS